MGNQTAYKFDYADQERPDLRRIVQQTFHGYIHQLIHIRDYFLAGDKLPWWMIGGSIIASNISSHHLVGAMGAAYNRGFVALPAL
ncbi:MAG TPA: hypothetical protein VN038_04550 [Dyadobacter sp.]|nr:hypothetical protein [Dyadobacter sp.]